MCFFSLKINKQKFKKKKEKKKKHTKQKLPFLKDNFFLIFWSATDYASTCISHNVIFSSENYLKI